MTDLLGKLYYPLVFAAERGHVMIVRQFLSRYSDYYAKGSPGHEIIYISLVEAIQASRIEVAKTLLDYFMIDVNDPLTKGLMHRYKSHSLLGIAAGNTHEEMAKFLLHCGANVNGKTRSVIPPDDSVNELENLDDNYESVHKQDDQYLSPLKIAVARCNTAIVDALCSFGADIMVKDSSGATLIHWLAKGDDADMRFYNFGQYARIVENLTRKGVDVAAIDNSQCTALHVAVNRSFPPRDLMLELVNAGTPINAQNSEGDTALNFLVISPRYANSEGVLLLLSLGADCSIPNNNGLTALDKARKKVKELHSYAHRRHYRPYIIEILTIASQDKFVEDIWRLFVDDS